MILGLVAAAVDTGARAQKACELLGIDVGSLRRWRQQDIGEDGRHGPSRAPRNKLSEAERRHVVAVVNLPDYRDLSPHQIVPKLADEGTYLASESTIYRILRAADQLQHRERAAPRTHHRPRELVATGPNQVWSWDITYLLSPVKGRFYYLYCVMDVFSRKIVHWAVHDLECAAHAVQLIAAACAREGIRREQLTIHADNGAPMKNGLVFALFQVLGVAASFSRPAVSDDNPFIEALFRTLKYRPSYPIEAFAAIAAARAWVAQFVAWYNTAHQHSKIRFVTPEQRHAGKDRGILAQRAVVYAAARTHHPTRWSRNTRNWSPIETVVLNPAAGAATKAAA